MATKASANSVDEKDKKISEVPHLTDVTGVEKIPVSAVGGLPRYVEVNQIATPISLEYIDSKFNPEGNNNLWLIRYKTLTGIVNIVRNICGLGLQDAKTLIESAPCLIRHFDTLEEAVEAKAQLDAVEGTVTEIR